MGTFEFAASSFERLCRAWPEAVFLSRRTATELTAPFDQEADMEEYIDELNEESHEAEHAVEEKFDGADCPVDNAEFYYFLAAGWLHTLLTDTVFAWLDA